MQASRVTRSSTLRSHVSPHACRPPLSASSYSAQRWFSQKVGCCHLVFTEKSFCLITDIIWVFFSRIFPYFSLVSCMIYLPVPPVKRETLSSHDWYSSHLALTSYFIPTRINAPVKIHFNPHGSGHHMSA